MRYLSENFKEIQDELIRPQMNLYFEVGTEVFKAVQTESRKRGVAVSNGAFSR